MTAFPVLYSLFIVSIQYFINTSRETWGPHLSFHSLFSIQATIRGDNTLIRSFTPSGKRWSIRENECILDTRTLHLFSIFYIVCHVMRCATFTTPCIEKRMTLDVRDVDVITFAIRGAYLSRFYLNFPIFLVRVQIVSKNFIIM